MTPQNRNSAESLRRERISRMILQRQSVRMDCASTKEERMRIGLEAMKYIVAHAPLDKIDEYVNYFTGEDLK